MKLLRILTGVDAGAQLQLADPAKWTRSVRRSTPLRSETQGATDLDRNNLAKLYREFLAAARVIIRPQETQVGARLKR
ncbi:hypothetical protein [Paraburkholderia aspalathi]|uniref:hypothetical protein n=1 Tax=Paraburkholderia aspalathi TaxID=1324617 RepID=UPI0038BB3BBF